MMRSNGFRSVNRVQGGHQPASGLRRFQRHFDGFPVAHFANQDHFRRLPQRRAKRQRKRGRVHMQFALMDGGFFAPVRMMVFDGQNVDGPFFIHLPDDGCQRR